MCGNLCRSLFYPFLLVCFVLHGRSTLAQYEEILRFESSITVRADSVLLVEERIRVNALGTKIEHFINRDFPIATRDRWGFRYRVNIEFLEVLRDGVPEPYTVETLSGISVGGFPGGKRLRMGKENIDISPGEHEYTIKYKTFPQIRYFEDYDELLWNVTGNDWDFPIRHAIARVTFPRQIPLSEVHPSGFTGKAGVSGSAFKEYRLGADKSIFMFETTAPLAEHESLTLSMTFPKGFLWEPTSIQKRNWWIESNPGQLYALGGLILVTFFYLGIWLLVGKDPFSGTMIPRYRPPDGLSAGDTRYLSKMGFDRDVLTAEILHLATRGALRISYDDTDEFALTKVSPCEVELSTTDENLLNALFGNDEVASLRVAESNSSTFLQAQNTLKKNLSAKYLRYHFLKNMKFFVVGLLLSIGTLWISAWKESYEPLSLILITSVCLSLWTLALFALSSQVFPEWKKALAQGEPFSAITAIGSSILAVLSLAGLGVGVFLLYQGTSLIFILVTLLLGVCGYYFHHLLKPPTIRGEKVVDQIEGLRHYLGVAEEERARQVSDPELSMELYEKFLAYAIALDVDSEWAKRFSTFFTTALYDNGGGTLPSFYQGTDLSHFSTGFGTAFSAALQRALRTSRTRNLG